MSDTPRCQILTSDTRRDTYMKIIGILLLVVCGVGLALSTMMFGDSGIAAAIGSISAVLTGVGFMKLNKQLGIQMK